MKKISYFSPVIALVFLGFAGTTQAAQINTGGKQGAYFGTFCPLLEKALKKSQFEHKCVPSRGSRENMIRVSSNPAQVGFSQLDVYALEKSLLDGEDQFRTMRSDIAQECLFLVSKNKDLTNFGQVSANADKLNFILPPERSGSAGTFEFLQKIDPDGLGKASKSSYAVSTDEALAEVLESDDSSAITLFVQFPDPDNPRFKKIAEKGGHFIPVIDRNVLRQDIGGEKIYFAQETEIVNPKWDKKSVKVITACTPMILFTGAPNRLPKGKERQEQKDLIKTVKAVPVEDLRPKKGLFSRLLKQTKSLSAKGLEQVLDASEKAREAAKPMVKKVKEMAEDAKDSAKPMMDKAKEMGEKALEKAGEMADDAKESAKEMMEKKK